ncbi:MAG: 4Fe-4S binding protein [Chloroflexi bacterium]|nr:4Fe-4S binding protein [Chloroflexota bacterium]
MCEFCTRHGEGQKWYLTMSNYSRELWEQKGREDFTEHFMARFEEQYGKSVATLDRIANKPVLGRIVRRMVTRRQKTEHWGQIVPIEDAERILDMQDSVVRLPCVCRQVTTGRQERYCFGLGIDPSGFLGEYPDYSHSLEVLGKDESRKLLRLFDKQGLVHSIWTFKTPYIGGICNCDQDCVAYRLNVKSKLMKNMFRAEYVGLVDWDLCNGCKKCLLQCQFGAIHHSVTMKRVTIDTMQCYGCGVCRTVCDKEAIRLKARTDFARLPW